MIKIIFGKFQSEILLFAKVVLVPIPCEIFPSEIL